ncbi:unnamed protein product [Rhizophagus irregularis]|nr:unnamed protein product [Rhizophagus irregularis]
MKLMTRRDQDESDDDFIPIRQQKRKKNEELELHKESVGSVPKKAKTARNEDIDLMIHSLATIEPKDPTSSNFFKVAFEKHVTIIKFAISNRGTQIKTTKGSSATVFSDSKSQCLDKSPIEKADEQISSADETNMMI